MCKDVIVSHIMKSKYYEIKSYRYVMNCLAKGIQLYAQANEPLKSISNYITNQLCSNQTMIYH